MTARASDYTYYSEDVDRDEDFYANEESGKKSQPRKGSRGSRTSSKAKMMISQPMASDEAEGPIPDKQEESIQDEVYDLPPDDKSEEGSFNVSHGAAQREPGQAETGVLRQGSQLGSRQGTNRDSQRNSVHFSNDG